MEEFNTYEKVHSLFNKIASDENWTSFFMAYDNNFS